MPNKCLFDDKWWSVFCFLAGSKRSGAIKSWIRSYIRASAVTFAPCSVQGLALNKEIISKSINEWINKRLKNMTQTYDNVKTNHHIQQQKNLIAMCFHKSQKVQNLFQPVSCLPGSSMGLKHKLKTQGPNPTWSSPLPGPCCTPMKVFPGTLQSQSS